MFLLLIVLLYVLDRLLRVEVDRLVCLVVLLYAEVPRVLDRLLRVEVDRPVYLNCSVLLVPRVLDRLLRVDVDRVVCSVLCVSLPRRGPPGSDRHRPHFPRGVFESPHPTRYWP